MIISLAPGRLRLSRSARDARNLPIVANLWCGRSVSTRRGRSLVPGPDARIPWLVTQVLPPAPLVSPRGVGYALRAQDKGQYTGRNIGPIELASPAGKQCLRSCALLSGDLTSRSPSLAKQRNQERRTVEWRFTQAEDRLKLQSKNPELTN